MLREIYRLFLLILIIFLVSTGYSFAEEKWYFKTLREDIIRYDYAIKLKDGRFLCPRWIHADIFDSKTNTFKKTADFKLTPSLHGKSSILLEDGKVLFIDPYIYPSCSDELDLYSLISDDLFKKKLKKYRIVESTLTVSEIREFRRQVYLDEYASLYEHEREKLFMPYLKKNPELLKKYNDCVARYEQSMYGQIYDPVTETFEFTKGKLNIRRRDARLVLLKNGNVLIMGGRIPRDKRLPVGVSDKVKERATQMEVYNPKTQTFSLIPRFLSKDDPIIWNGYKFLLNDGTIYYSFGKIYDPETDSYKKSVKLEGSGPVKLDDGRIVSLECATSEIKVTNPITGEISTLGKILIPRGWVGLRMLPLKNDKILIYGGINEAWSNYFMGSVYENRVEIFDIKTGKSSVIRKFIIPPSYMIYDAFSLDNGSALIISTKGIELLFRK